MTKQITPVLNKDSVLVKFQSGAHFTETAVLWVSSVILMQSDAGEYSDVKLYVWYCPPPYFPW